MDQHDTMEQPEQEMPLPPKPRCRNCEKKMPRQSNFCPHCGQKNFDGRIRLRDMLGKFLFHLTHLDNKFLNACWRLLVPGMVTKEYFQGKIKKYPHPVQFFFIIMFFFLLLFSKVNSDQTLGKVSQERADGKTTELKGDEFYKALENYVLRKKYEAAIDSLPAEWRTPITQKALDSVMNKVNFLSWRQDVIHTNNKGPDGKDLEIELDSIPFTMGSMSMSIATTDLVGLSPEAVVEKYKMTSFFPRIMVVQGIKSIRDPKALLHNYLGSLAWSVLVLIGLMAFFMRILYYRQKKYYVEHFIFLLHFHSGAFLLFTVLLAIHLIYPMKVIWVLAGLGTLFALYIAMYRYYGQGKIKTLLKWFIYNMIYAISFGVLFLLGLATVFLLF